jgi:lysozyme
MSDRILADLERDEGYRAHSYRDTENIWSLGIGRNLEANPLTGDEWKQLLDAGEIAVSISLAGSRRLVRNALPVIAVQCATTFAWWVALHEPRREVISNLVFNLGLKKLLGFREMLKAMAAGDYDRAAEELQDSRWFKQVLGLTAAASPADVEAVCRRHPSNRGPRLVNQLRTGVRQ